MSPLPHNFSWGRGDVCTQANWSEELEYSQLPIIRIFKGNRKHFEFAGADCSRKLNFVTTPRFAPQPTTIECDFCIFLIVKIADFFALAVLNPRYLLLCAGGSVNQSFSLLIWHVYNTMLGAAGRQYYVLLHGAKRLTGFKLCSTTPHNTQQHATGCANGRNMYQYQCCVP